MKRNEDITSDVICQDCTDKCVRRFECSTFKEAFEVAKHKDKLLTEYLNNKLKQYSDGGCGHLNVIVRATITEIMKELELKLEN